MPQVVILKTDPTGEVHQAIIPIGHSSASRKELCQVIDTKTGATITRRERTPREEAAVEKFDPDKTPCVYRFGENGLVPLQRELSTSERDVLEAQLAEGRQKVVFLEANHRLDDASFSPPAPTAAASSWGRRQQLSQAPSIFWQG